MSYLQILALVLCFTYGGICVVTASQRDQWEGNVRWLLGSVVLAFGFWLAQRWL